MNAQERYDRWVEERRKPVLQPGFADRVMERVRLMSPPGPQPPAWTQGILNWMGLHPFAQAAAILLAVLFTVANGAWLLRIGIG